MFCDAIISIDKVITGNIFYQWNLQVIWDYLIEKAMLDWVEKKNELVFLIYVLIHAKLIDRGLKKYMFCDAIISIDKSITGNIYILPTECTSYLRLSHWQSYIRLYWW